MSDLNEILQAGVCYVRFLKANGEVRNMICTQKPELIPEKNHPKGTGKPNDNPDLFRVYDLTAEGWRSFHESCVIHFSSNNFFIL